MNHIQTETTDPPTDSLEVEFYPSVEDYVHIGSRVTASVGTPATIQYIYQGFLFINAVGFPAFLWFNNYYLIGIVIAVLNIAALAWLIPWSIRDGYRAYYEQVIGPREKEIARVKLNSAGIRYTSDNGETFLPWQRITAIEETDDAIFFFFAGNGLAVRKSGFAYRGEQDAFTRFARANLDSARNPQLEQ
jgi:hypothetical protein